MLDEFIKPACLLCLSRNAQYELMQGVHQYIHHFLAPQWLPDALCLELLMPHTLLDKHTWWVSWSRLRRTAGVAMQ